NGEFHTFAYAGPMFRHAIAITPGEVVERDGFVFADLMPAQWRRPTPLACRSAPFGRAGRRRRAVGPDHRRRRPGGGVDRRGGGRPAAPRHSHCATISSRRFWALPAAVLLLAIGFVLPNASVLLRLGLMPFSTM